MELLLWMVSLLSRNILEETICLPTWSLKNLNSQEISSLKVTTVLFYEHFSTDLLFVEDSSPKVITVSHNFVQNSYTHLNLPT